MEKNVRVAVAGNVGIYPERANKDGTVVFDVMLNDTGRDSDWNNPKYGKPIIASSEEDFKRQVEARYPGAFYPWSLKAAGVTFESALSARRRRTIPSPGTS